MIQVFYPPRNYALNPQLPQASPTVHTFQVTCNNIAVFSVLNGKFPEEEKFLNDVVNMSVYEEESTTYYLDHKEILKLHDMLTIVFDEYEDVLLFQHLDKTTPPGALGDFKSKEENKAFLLHHLYNFDASVFEVLRTLSRS
jgi:hypothetical protein